MFKQRHLYICLSIATVLLAVWGLIALRYAVERSAKSREFRVLGQARLLAGGEVLAFTALDSPDFDPNHSVGFTALDAERPPPVMWSTPGQPAPIDTDFHSERLFYAQRRPNGSRAEAFDLVELSVDGKSKTYEGGVPAGTLVFVPPDYVAVNTWTDLDDVKGGRTPRFFQIRNQLLKSIGRFKHSDAKCVVRDLKPVGPGTIVLYVYVASDDKPRFEVHVYDIRTETTIAQVETTVDCRNGLQLSVDAAKSHVAVASLRYVELRSLPELKVIHDFPRPPGVEECIAVSNQGRHVAFGGQGVWVWQASEGVSRLLHPADTEPKLTLKTKGSHGDHLDQGAAMHNYMMHSRHRTRFVEFLDDAGRLVEVTGDGVLSKWDVERQRQLESPRRLWK